MATRVVSILLQIAATLASALILLLLSYVSPMSHSRESAAGDQPPPASSPGPAEQQQQQQPSPPAAAPAAAEEEEEEQQQPSILERLQQQHQQLQQQFQQAKQQQPELTQQRFEEQLTQQLQQQQQQQQQLASSTLLAPASLLPASGGRRDPSDQKSRTRPSLQLRTPQQRELHLESVDPADVLQESAQVAAALPSAAGQPLARALTFAPAAAALAEGRNVVSSATHTTMSGRVSKKPEHFYEMTEEDKKHAMAKEANLPSALKKAVSIMEGATHTSPVESAAGIKRARKAAAASNRRSIVQSGHGKIEGGSSARGVANDHSASEVARLAGSAESGMLEALASGAVTPSGLRKQAAGKSASTYAHNGNKSSCMLYVAVAHLLLSLSLSFFFSLCIQSCPSWPQAQGWQGRQGQSQARSPTLQRRSSAGS